MNVNSHDKQLSHLKNLAPKKIKANPLPASQLQTSEKIQKEVKQILQASQDQKRASPTNGQNTIRTNATQANNKET